MAQGLVPWSGVRSEGSGTTYERRNTGVFYNRSNLCADFTNMAIGGLVHSNTKNIKVAEIHIQLLRSEVELCRTVGRSC